MHLFLCVFVCVCISGANVEDRLFDVGQCENNCTLLCLTEPDNVVLLVLFLVDTDAC